MTVAWKPSPRPDDALVGVRLFRVGVGGMLMSLNHGFGWLPGVNDAEPDGCGCERSPGSGCHCGLNAFHTLERAAGPNYEHYELWAPPDSGVVAAVVGWGDVEIHADGWRAQHAQIVAVGTPEPSSEGSLKQRCSPTSLSGSRQLAAAAAARYGVPIVPLGRLEAFAREHGRCATPGELPDRTGLEQPQTATGSSQTRQRVLPRGCDAIAAVLIALAFVAASLSAVIDDNPLNPIRLVGGALLLAGAIAVVKFWQMTRNSNHTWILCIFSAGVAAILILSVVSPRYGASETRHAEIVQIVSGKQQALLKEGRTPVTPDVLARSDDRLAGLLAASRVNVMIGGAPGGELRIAAVSDGKVRAETAIPWPRDDRRDTAPHAPAPPPVPAPARTAGDHADRGASAAALQDRRSP